MTLPELDLTGCPAPEPTPARVARGVRSLPVDSRASGLRLMPAPESAPPFDDEQTGRHLHVARSPGPPPATAPAAPVLRLVPTQPSSTTVPDLGAEPPRGRTPTAE
ncbi:MAG: hypothetical protein JWL64_1831, partial [Frankiales bacterium]|nr:hypothetical protein [Frankiales bacterium]